MPRPRRVLPHGTVVFVTISIEQGIALPANPVMNTVLKGILARAQFLYPVRICHYVIEGTHAHFILVVDNPADVRGFIERFKTESAHAVNRMLGRKKRTVWCQGYDSPVILTKSKVEHYIKYLYTNPTKDGLEEIDRYPGLSSWKMYRSGTNQIKYDWIRRKAIPFIDTNDVCYNRLSRFLKRASTEQHEFQLEPDAWMDVFDVDAKDRKDLNKAIIDDIYQLEESFAEQRKNEGRQLIGANRLRSQHIDTLYMPQRTGRRSLCVSDDIELRKKFITSIKLLIEQAKEVYNRWKVGDFSVPYPEALFPPHMPVLVEPLGLSALL